MPSRRDLSAEANRLFHLGDAPAALRLFTAMVRSAPHDLDARLRLADALARTGEAPLAVNAYTAMLLEGANAGYPLKAVVALKQLVGLDPAASQLFGALAERYAADTRREGAGARASAPDPDAEVPSHAFPPGAWSDRDVVTAVHGLLTARDSMPAWPAVVPAIPLLSSLPREAFARVLSASTLRRDPEGTVVLREGDPAASFFMVARGRVAVTRRRDGGEETLATLGEGSVFGEMALLSSAPRNATVRVVEDADLLEFGAASLSAAAGEIPAIAAGLERFMQQRLQHHATATHRLFQSLDGETRVIVASRFAHEQAAPGAVLIAEGALGRGLFLVLTGEVDVTRRAEGATVHLATLGAGEVFGEISVIEGAPAAATVTARTHVRCMMLPRAAAERLVADVPAVRAWLSELADARAMDTMLAVSGAPML